MELRRVVVSGVVALAVMAGCAACAGGAVGAATAQRASDGPLRRAVAPPSPPPDADALFISMGEKRVPGREWSSYDDCYSEYEVVDPFGERLTIPRVEFRQVAFRLSSHADLIEVADPSRDARLLFERLAFFGGPIIRPSPLVLDGRLWVRHLELRHGPAKVLAARPSDLALSTTAAASVSIKSTQDVRSHLGDLLRGRHGTVDRVQLEFKHRLGLVSIELTRDARAVVHEGGEAAGALAAEALSAVTNAAAGGVKQA